MGGIFQCLGIPATLPQNHVPQNHVPLGSNLKMQLTDMDMCMQFDAAAAARSANVAAELEAALGEAMAARAEMVRWRGDASAATAACDEVKVRASCGIWPVVLKELAGRFLRWCSCALLITHGTGIRVCVVIWRLFENSSRALPTIALLCSAVQLQHRRSEESRTALVDTCCMDSLQKRVTCPADVTASQPVVFLHINKL